MSDAPPIERIGLIAGYGKFPILFAGNAASRGVKVVAFGIRYEASPELALHVEKMHWVGVAQVGRLIKLMKSEGITRAVMAGKVRKTWMYTPFRIIRLMPDLRTVRLWFRRVKDRKDDTLLGAVANELASEGITLESSLLYCKDLLAVEGVMAGKTPTDLQADDILFGWKLARAMGGLDVGQSVAVKEKAVLAVEAIEGTDEAIRRAGSLGGRGFTVVKVSKPRQDVRFDVPAIGADTVRTMAQAGGAVLAVEAGSTLILGVKETVGLAEELGVTLVGLRDRGDGSGPAIPGR